ncbi:MAG: ABC transporter permease [Gammaproteobacteria bacterium]|nr:ABC transporter permease [Gammaproteobacteria bacterium]
MLRYVIRRTLFMVSTIWVVVTLTFFLLRAAPGGPFDTERAVSAAVEANLRAAYNLDAPLLEQYGSYLADLLRGDLGPSYKQKDFNVAELLLHGLPISLLIGGLALAIAVVLGLAFGATMARYRNRIIDSALESFVTCGLALPPLVAAPLLVLLFAVVLQWLPAGGLDSGWHFILPVISLCIPYIAAFARLSRSSCLEALNQPFTTAAQAKGVNTWRLLWHHVLPSAFVPVLSFVGPAAATLLAGSMVVEVFFAIPGIGHYFVQGALDRDYTLVLGAVLVYTSSILVLNFIIDLALLRLDPRIRLT